MNCDICGTQLKYVFNFMTVCPKCDYPADGLNVHSPRAHKESMLAIYDFTSCRKWTDQVCLKGDDLKLNYYNPPLKNDYSFLLYNNTQTDLYFPLTKEEAGYIAELYHHHHRGEEPFKLRYNGNMYNKDSCELYFENKNGKIDIQSCTDDWYRIKEFINQYI